MKIPTGISRLITKDNQEIASINRCDEVDSIWWLWIATVEIVISQLPDHAVSTEQKR
jgi:hypothetical protein